MEGLGGGARRVESKKITIRTYSNSVPSKTRQTTYTYILLEFLNHFRILVQFERLRGEGGRTVEMM